MIGRDLVFVGCGNMAGAILARWLEAGLVNQAIVIKPTPLAWDDPRVAWHAPDQAVPDDFKPDLIVLGVKPQRMDEILPDYRRYAGQAPFLSLAAGKTLAYFTRHLGPAAAVIRSMPNLASRRGKGVTGCVANDRVTTAQRSLTTDLLQAVGQVHWIDEGQMDALTALSGSGLAYVFLLEEVLAKAGVGVGLSSQLATSLARQTIIGAAALREESATDAAILRAGVTSKAGVTEAGLKILLQDNALPRLFADALAASVKRAGELAE